MITGATTEASFYCDVCMRHFEDGRRTTTKKHLRQIEKKVGFPLTCVCRNCYVNIKSMKAKTSSVAICKNLAVVESLELGGSDEHLETWLKNAKIAEIILESRVRDLMSKFDRINSQYNKAKIARIAINTAYYNKLWSSYPERRKRADRAISDFQLRIMIFGRDGNKCKRCGCQDNLTIDHILPVASGGDESLNNLQTLCKSCNSKKGSQTEFK